MCLRVVVVRYSKVSYVCTIIIIIVVDSKVYRHY